MSKKDKQVDIAPTDFQLNAKDFENGNFVVDKIVDGVVNWANHADFNKDGRSDIAELEPVVKEALPIILELAPLIHVPTLLHYIADLPVFTDKAKVVAAIEKLAPLANKAAAIVTKTEAPATAQHSDALEGV